ncbi:MAG: hypothetical protein ACFFE2_02530 [Candidatus Thorarchaeota archaeon]
MRTGVKGYPREDWELGIKTMQFCDQFNITATFLRRFWNVPTDHQFTQMARSKAIIHGSVGIPNPPEHVSIILDVLERYEELKGWSVRRVITIPLRVKAHYQKEHSQNSRPI